MSLSDLRTFGLQNLRNEEPFISDLRTSGLQNLRTGEQSPYTVVPVLGDPRRERPRGVYGHVINVPTHCNVKLPAIGGHLPNADADSHLLVVRTCYNGQCKQMPHFRLPFEPEIARGQLLYYYYALF